MVGNPWDGLAPWWLTLPSSAAAYQNQRHANDNGLEDNTVVNSHENQDEHRQIDQVIRPLEQDLIEQICALHSRGSVTLRYAAFGFLPTLAKR